MTFDLSLTVSELLAFFCGPEMTSCRFLRQVASQVKYKGGFCKAVPDFLFVINYDFWSISYRFRVISVCLWTGNDVMPIFSARWRLRSNIKADSERQYPTSYSRLIMIFGLSLTIFELFILLILAGNSYLGEKNWTVLG